MNKLVKATIEKYLDSKTKEELLLMTLTQIVAEINIAPSTFNRYLEEKTGIKRIIKKRTTETK